MTTLRPMDVAGLVWFRRDLRLGDNPAWADATRSHRDVVALVRGRPPTARRLRDRSGLAQLRANLVALDRTLAEAGGRLLVRQGDPGAGRARVAARLGAGAVLLERRRVALVDAARCARPVGAADTSRSHPFGHPRAAAGSVRDQRRRRAPGLRRVPPTLADHRLGPWPERRPRPTSPTIPATAWTTCRSATATPQPAGEDGAHAALERFLAGPIDDYREGATRSATRGRPTCRST